ncbi:MAG TPA: hypothetical protein P5530_01720 [Candidatus Diapherotrites archaeon]|nr:hypothetical protein [Candidatus Diapherotrites archaeon]
MAKKENRSLIIWALICLAVGLIMGLFLTTVVTTGKAMKALGERANLENVSIPVDNINYPDSYYVCITSSGKLYRSIYPCR